MSTTPQIIKDQEFQIKFRGYDPVEVKAYLDVLADEFFELQEHCRLQVDDLQSYHEQIEALEQQKISWEASSDEARKMAEELRQAGLRMEQKIATQAKEMEGLRVWVTTLEQEKKKKEEALSSSEARIHKAEGLIARERAEKETLERKIQLMEEQQRAAKQDEVDFKSTLAAAQQFCDSMKEKSKQEAERLLAEARAEIAEIRRAAHAELSRLPGEIEALQQKREEARSVLRTTLESYLQNLDIFPAVDKVQGATRESEELFQKIQILEDGSLAVDDLAALHLEPGFAASSDEETEDLLSLFAGDEATGGNNDEERI